MTAPTTYIRLTDENVEIKGVITHLTPQYADALMLETPPDFASWRVSSPVCLVVQVLPKVYLLEGEISAISGLALKVRLNEFTSRTQQRSYARYACNLPVLFRAIRADQSKGFWLNGAATDISQGGISLHTQASNLTPSCVELRLHFASETAEAAEADQGVRIASARTRGVLSVVGRIRRCAPAPEGGTQLGVQFAEMEWEDLQRLRKYIETLPPL